MSISENGVRASRTTELLSHSESVPRISPTPVIAVLMIMGWVLAFLAEFLHASVEAAGLGILLIGLSVVAWTLNSRNTYVGRWCTIVVLIVTVLLADGWLHLPGALGWMAIPTGLAAALLNLYAAVGTALGQTALLLLLPLIARWVGVVAIDWVAAGVALGAIWATFGMMMAVYTPVSQAIGQSEAYFERARRSIKEARDRKAELAQVLADLTDANRQLALASERMAALRAVAEGARKAKAMFVAKVSHEFRTPLNMIIGLVDLMVETPELYDVVLPPEMSSDLEVVHRNCVHLTNMVNDVLSLTQMEAGRLALRREHVDLQQLIDNAVTSVRPLIDKKGLFLRVTVPDDLPQIYCDGTRIQQVILNLMSNAARFTAQGGITVDVEPGDQHVLVSVTDTGPGIAAQDVQVIFEPFSQGVSHIWRDKGGTGLGLTISKQFVQLHGGRMWLESEIDVGTAFFFELPISGQVEHATRPGHQIRGDWIWREGAFWTERSGVADQIKGPRVVICDETGALHPQFASYSGEVEFVETRDLDQAAAALRRCPAHALVLNAPTPEGLWPLVESARAATHDTPIVGCTVPQPIAQAVEAGAVEYLTKPVTRADLEEAIQQVGHPVRRVLVVDDDPDVLRLFTRILHACDGTLSVDTASNGEQALEAVRSNSPDLVLLDIFMPGMDGWQVLERLRQDVGATDLPVLFVSAQDLAGRPPESRVLLATMGEGLSISQLLRCSLALPNLLLTPAGEPGPEYPQIAAARPASADTLQTLVSEPDALP